MHSPLPSLVLLLLSALMPLRRTGPALATAYTALSDTSLPRIPFPSLADINIKSGGLLAPILIPRVPGTEGNRKVRKHFTDFFSHELPNWKLEFDFSNFTTPTSNGKEVPFVNLIARLDPPNADHRDVKRLTLVAHYDSKLTPKGFIGATDSAAPCAMLLHIARAVTPVLESKWADLVRRERDEGFFDLDDPMGLEIIFLDGEEAFENWSDDDSLYGARNLAQAWEHQHYDSGKNLKNRLANIELFVLLDLLGSADPIATIPSYFKDTHWAYKKLSNLESRLRAQGVMKSAVNGARNGKTQGWLFEGEKREDEVWMGGMVGDDHVPFLQRGVKILHLIPTPFPKVWHTEKDDGEHLDLETVRDWAGLMTGFVVEWMGAGDFLPGPPKVEVKERLEKLEKRGEEVVEVKVREGGPPESRKTEL
ncbi:putative glutaminyl cyclase [Ascobolus immersus RN42]|uniref:Peptide hydrolase n=1 Tax=Ascobolus immersus RN42 TaxID=1160509 RepID=A0A3N4I8X3_ASCIM|nr:putative glutaminyl cyclase [Ascobolus immersus RN42]